MTKENMVAVLKIIHTAYPTSGIAPNDDTISLWCNLLNDIPDGILVEVVNRYIATNKFAPTIAGIREACVEMVAKASGELTADEGWEQVFNAIGRYGRYNPKGAFDSMDPNVATIARRMQWQMICSTEDTKGSVNRSTFIRMYNDHMNRLHKEVMAPNGFREKLAELAAAQQQNQLTEGAQAE